MTTSPFKRMSVQEAEYIAAGYQREAEYKAMIALLWLDTVNILRKEEIEERENASDHRVPE